ncbi:MAG TPA: energy transducer TonB [Candidatus Sulfotelmatobacter sp.]
MTLSAIVLLPAARMSAQDRSADRKVLTRVAPNYPELARRMHIRGVVKLEVTVRPDGDVKTTRVVGGNPVLIQAAVDAVAKWKFEVSPNETTEVLQLTFQP